MWPSQNIQTLTLTGYSLWDRRKFVLSMSWNFCSAIVHTFTWIVQLMNWPNNFLNLHKIVFYVNLCKMMDNPTNNQPPYFGLFGETILRSHWEQEYPPILLENWLFCQNIFYWVRFCLLLYSSFVGKLCKIWVSMNLILQVSRFNINKKIKEGIWWFV